MWRKRATPAPGFKQPAPFSPISGQFAPVGKPGLVSRLTMCQVIEEDTHANYVVCKTWDLDKDADCHYLINTVSVAKPYGTRGTYPYVVGQVLTCAKVRTVLGDNCGVAETTVGHPADLEEVIEILLDDDEVAISWILVEGDDRLPLVRFKLNENLLVCGSASATILIPVESSEDADQTCTCGNYIEGATITVYDRIGYVGACLLALEDPVTGDLYVSAGVMGYAQEFTDVTASSYEVVSLGEAECTKASDSASDSDSDSDSTSDSASAPICRTELQVFLRSVPIAGANDEPVYVLGKDAAGCLKWFPVNENCEPPSS